MAFIQEILTKLGWNDGFQMPAANAENQKLEQELAELSLKKIKSKSSFDSSGTRLQNLKDHFKFLNQENEQTQKIITAHKQQYDTEVNQFHSLSNEKNKFDQDISDVNKRIKFLEENRENQRKTLEKSVLKVDKIKQETGWDIEALKAWDEALKKRDDDNELIKKFSKDDERKFNELETRRQLLQSEYDTKSSTVQKMVCDLHSCEMIIERTGKAIKQQINEREALIKQWKDSVKMLQQRDVDIEHGQERIFIAEKELGKQSELLDEENSMLANEKKNNHAIELEIESLNATNSRMRRELSDLQQNVYTISNEFQSYKRRVTTTANSLEQLRIRNRHLDIAIEEQTEKCVKDELDMENLAGKINEMKGSNVSSAERIKKIQKLLESEEKCCAVLMGDTEKINSNLYRTDQLLKDQQSKGKIFDLEINNGYCICNKLRKHIRDERKAVEKLKEVVYDMEFRIDEFEQKLCKLEGSNKSDDHSDEKEEKIRDLEKTVAEFLEIQHTLQNQVDRLQDEMRRLTNFIESDRQHLETLQNKVENNLMIYDIGKKQIAAAKKSSQENQVEENIMRLRINHIEAEVDKEDQKIFNLQKLRLTLDQVMKERNLDIETKKTIVLAKKRNIEEDRARLKSDMTIRKIKIQQMQKKYHIELMALGRDEDGQPLSVTFFKIKTAQEKFLLQQQGDELDQKIKIAEKEIVAMENTLKMVNLTNVAFKNNLTPLKEDDIEVKEMKLLEKLHKEWRMKFRQSKQELDEQEALNNETLRELNEEVKPENSVSRNMIQKLEDENLVIEKQERDKQEKLHRTEVHLRRLLKKLGSRDLTVYDQDLEVRQLKDANETVLKRLSSMINEYLEVAPNITKYLTEHQIKFKSQYSISTNTFSTASSISSVRSNTSTATLAQIKLKKVDVSF